MTFHGQLAAVDAFDAFTVNGAASVELLNGKSDGARPVEAPAGGFVPTPGGVALRSAVQGCSARI